MPTTTWSSRSSSASCSHGSARCCVVPAPRPRSRAARAGSSAAGTWTRSALLPRPTGAPPRTPDGKEVPLTRMEFDLLKVLVSNPNRVLTRDQLLDLAHNDSWEPFDRSIDIRVARLRKKIERDPARPEAIRTVRGAGYMFVPGTQGASGWRWAGPFARAGPPPRWGRPIAWHPPGRLCPAIAFLLGSIFSAPASAPGLSCRSGSGSRRPVRACWVSSARRPRGRPIPSTRALGDGGANRARRAVRGPRRARRQSGPFARRAAASVWRGVYAG